MRGGHCKENPYYIPQLFIKDITSSEYLVLDENRARARRARECKEGSECFGKTVYGVVLDEIIDIVEKSVVKSFIVVLPPQYTKALFLKEGSHVEPIPLEGVRVSLEVCEGDKVDKNSTIGYVSTRKWEFRHIRSHVEGVVVYIHYSPYGGVERNIVFIAPEKEVTLIDVV